MACLIHSSIPLDYCFPSRKEFEDIRKNATLPRDVLISQNLTLDKLPHPREPVPVARPIQKTYSHQVQEDPLEALYRNSKHVIDSYTESMIKSIPKTATTISNVNNHLRQQAGQKEESSLDKTQGYHSSPAAGKTLYFSPQVAKKTNVNLTQSTPDPAKDSTRRKLDFGVQGHSKMRKVDLLQSAGKKSSLPVQIYEDSQHEIEEDNLACHAGNILRMAMDTTLLGSSYNTSINSSFGLNDSILDNKRDAANGHVHEGEDSISSLRNYKRGGLNLNKKKATKVEISAEDLNNAINAVC